MFAADWLKPIRGYKITVIKSIKIIYKFILISNYVLRNRSYSKYPIFKYYKILKSNNSASLINTGISVKTLYFLEWYSTPKNNVGPF